MRRAMILGVCTWVMVATVFAAPLTVGIEGRREVVLPEAALKAKAPERAAPMTLRIASATVQEGGTRYDLRFVGLVPGRYDLRTYLRRADGTAAEGLPPVEVEVRGLLPPDQGAMMLTAPQSTVHMLGGYRWAMMGVGMLWLLGAIPLFRRRRGAAVVAPAVELTRLTLPERVRPLVERAAAGSLSVKGKAELERMVLAHWCEELGLGDLPRAEALARFRDHPQAGPLLRALEEWLHQRPGGTRVDLQPLLAAYAPAPPREVGVS